MRNHWASATVLTCALTVACADSQPETVANLELDTPSTAAENTGVAENAPPAAPAASAPKVSPRRDTTLATPSNRISPSADRNREERRSVEAAPVAPRWRDVTVPKGTALSLELLTAVSSETAAVETPVRAKLRHAVVVDDYRVIPAGTVFYGNVTEVERAGRVKGRSHLAFRFTEAELDEGREELRTSTVSFEGEATKSEDATKIGVGAAGGAIVGGLLGGGSGAAKGAAIGGAAGTGVVLATRGKEVSLEAGTNVTATLASAYTLRVPAE